jgi:hypothetical protein
MNAQNNLKKDSGASGHNQAISNRRANNVLGRPLAVIGPAMGAESRAPKKGEKIGNS